MHRIVLTFSTFPRKQFASVFRIQRIVMVTFRFIAQLSANSCSFSLRIACPLGSFRVALQQSTPQAPTPGSAVR